MDLAVATIPAIHASQSEVEDVYRRRCMEFEADLRRRCSMVENIWDSLVDGKSICSEMSPDGLPMGQRELNALPPTDALLATQTTRKMFMVRGLFTYLVNLACMCVCALN